MSPISLPADIRNLSIPDRVHLAQQIWDSVAEDEQAFELTAKQRAELDRRIAAHEASPDRGKSWEDVNKRLRGG